MKCPNCGAEVDSAYCGYCGTKMPREVVETQTIHGDHVVVNNYYVVDSDSVPYDGPIGGSQYGSSQYASAQYAGYATPQASHRSRMVALMLCIFLGYFGAHRFYAGHIGLGILYLLTVGIFGFGWIIDIVLIALGKMTDNFGLPISNW